MLAAAGRPKEARVDEAVREAVVALLAERGYERMTIADVAARARVGRGALYRRWNSKAEMTFASVVHPLELGDPPNRGTLRGDLTALAGIVHARVSDRSAAAALAGLVSGVRDDPTLAAALDERLFAEERRWIATILDRARARGEMRSAYDPELVRQLLVGTIAFVVLYQPEATVLVEQIADLLARGLSA
jgi:AcrR family transcriptional regulator